MGMVGANGDTHEPTGGGANVTEIANRYRVFATLGRGGMADVFLAAAQGPGGFTKLVVLKKLRGARGEDPSFVTMFLDEARLSARLNHPNVVNTYEVGQDGDVYFIVMEYLEGQPLHRIAKALAERGERLAPAIAARILAEALRGLDHAHELKDYDGSALGIVHRDVSPQNLHVAYDGQVRVLDFGIAKAALNTSQTQAGVLKGKFAYMSPEQTTGDDVDRRSDVFAAGIVLWELLAGQRLFKGDNAVAIAQLVQGRVEPPSSRFAGVPEELDAIVMRALQRDRADRYATAREMANALDDFLHRTGVRVPREEVARCLKEVFGSAQEETQRQIQVHMASLAPSSSSSPSFSYLPALQTGPHGALSSLPPPSRAVSSGGFMSAPPADSNAVLESVDVPMPTLHEAARPATASSRTIRARYVLFAGAAMAAAAAFLLLLRTRPPPQSSSDTVSHAAAPGSAASSLTSATTPAGPVGDSLHLTLSSEPLEAQVEWEGKVVGHTPMLIDLLPGPQSFVLSREGYFNTSIVLSVSDSMVGRAQSRTVVLVSRPPDPVAPRPANPELRGRRAASAASAKPQVAVERAADAPTEQPLGSRTSAGDVVGASAAAPPQPTPAALTAQAASPPPVPSVLPFGPEMSRPVLLSGSDPVYTREASLAKIEGTVVARCTITVAGTLDGCRILKGLPFMDQSMLDALATRRYSPVVYQGRPVAVEYVFNVRLVTPH